jgi:hypothetical protein
MGWRDRYDARGTEEVLDPEQLQARAREAAEHEAAMAAAQAPAEGEPTTQALEGESAGA